jgi:hypothetical protein
VSDADHGGARPRVAPEQPGPLEAGEALEAMAVREPVVEGDGGDQAEGVGVRVELVDGLGGPNGSCREWASRVDLPAQVGDQVGAADGQPTVRQAAEASARAESASAAVS